MEGTVKLNSPLPLVLVLPTSSMVWPIFFSWTSSPAEGRLVVPFWTAPRIVSAFAAIEQAKKSMMTKCFNRLAPSGFGGFQLFDFSQNACGFSFHADAHGIVIRFSKLARLIFKIQVAQVFVHDFFAFIKIDHARFVHACFSVARGEEDEDPSDGRKQAAKNLHQDQKRSVAHISVSWRARARNASRSGFRLRSASATGAVRSFQLRTRKITRTNPKPSARGGRIQAISSKPCDEGSTTAVTPHFRRNQLSTSSSVLETGVFACAPGPRPPLALSGLFDTRVRSSRVMVSELGQPTWLHLSSIWEQPQVHMILLPRFS